MDFKMHDNIGSLSTLGGKDFNNIPDLNSLSEILEEACLPNISCSKPVLGRNYAEDIRIYENDDKEKLSKMSMKCDEEIKNQSLSVNAEEFNCFYRQNGVDDRKSGGLEKNFTLKNQKNDVLEMGSRGSRVENVKGFQEKNDKFVIKIPNLAYGNKDPNKVPNLDTIPRDFQKGRAFNGKFSYEKPSHNFTSNRMNPIGDQESESQNYSQKDKKCNTWKLPIDKPSSQTAKDCFSLATYKTEKCKIGDKCTGCTKYHHEGEKRRDINIIQYLPVLCPNANDCALKNRCNKAHNLIELFYHPQIYKSLYCPYIEKNRKCPFGNLCNFIHLAEVGNSFTKPTIKCASCKHNDITKARAICGHVCCNNCSQGNECHKCYAPGDTIKLEFN